MWCFLCCVVLAGFSIGAYDCRNTPSMRNADNVINVAQGELEQLVCHDASSITEAKERVVRENGSQTHRTCMQDSLVA